MRCIFLYNPISGKGKIEKKVEYIKTQLLKKFDFVDIYETQSREDMINKAYDACDIYDYIIFSGGDGTFNDICNCVSNSNKRPILGYIPSGTANDIAKNLKISRNIKKALDVIINGKVIKHDVGMINDRYFMYVCGCGTFTSVSYKTSQKWKKRFKTLAYAFDGMKDLFSPTLVNAKITIDDQIIENKSPLILILNSKSIGGVSFNKRGHLNDGYFDIVVCKKFWSYIGGIVHLIIIGTFKGRDHTRYYDFYRGSNFKIEVDDNVTWCVDGEKGPSGSVNIKNISKHLQIVVPKKNKLFIEEENENNSR